MKISPELRSLCESLVQIREEAKALGIFVEDREILSCSICNFMEDVLIDGRLVTYISTKEVPFKKEDSGLRFKEISLFEFECPVCGNVVIEEN